MKVPRLTASLTRFSMRSLFAAVLCVGIALAWWMDRRQLEGRIQALEERLNPTKVVGRSWSPQQATGPPNTPTAGDFQTAWASATRDGQPEWLELRYAKKVRPRVIEVHESYNPGALFKITAVDEQGKEIILWKGTDPTPVGSGRGVSRIPVKTALRTDRIKIYLASDKVAGWNEIDAVGIQYSWGRTLWAAQATASTTYGMSPRPLQIQLQNPASAAVFR